MKTLENHSRVVPWLTALLLSILAAGCGGGGGQAPILGGSVATMAPLVTAVFPSAGSTAIPINRKTVTAVFSKAMDPATLNTSSFTLSCAGATPTTGAAVGYNTAGNVATLTLAAANNLPPNTLCTATVSTAAKDTLGAALATNFSWVFTTGAIIDTTPPTVTGTVNANGATDVAVNADISATFSESMNPFTVNGTNFTMKESVTGNAVAGTVSYSGVTVEFRPAALLTAGTRYTLTIKGSTGGVTDLADNAMASDYVWSWTTGVGGTPDTTAPVVNGTVPVGGATNVFTNTKVSATFSEAMRATTITDTNVLVTQTSSGAAVSGTLSYTGVNATFVPLSVLNTNTSYTVRIRGGTSGVKDLAGNAMVNDYTSSWTTGAGADSTAPKVIVVNPADLATNVAVNSTVNATFDEAMDPLTISTANFSVAGVTGLVSYNASSNVATLTPSSNLAANTTYTATVSTGAKDLAGNALALNKVWSFTTAVVPVVSPSVSLGSAGSYGSFGGTAGMTNMGTLTLVNGNIGTTATGTSAVTGFHDTAGDIYTQTPSNMGTVNGLIYTCTHSTTGPTSAGVNAASCALATQARLDAQSAYLALAAMPPGANPGANLAGLTLAPGVYTSPSGSFLIEGADLTLDAQGNANATWVFQMATTLTVGGPGAAAPRSIILKGGAQARNVFWQVGSFATINAGGGGTMVGNILAQAGVSVSTAGNVNVVTLNGRALSLGASVTLVNTVINMP